MTIGVACPPIVLQFTLNNGQLANGGFILTQVGGVNAATYSDSALSVPLPNPIPLNSRGEVSDANGISQQLFLTPNIVYTFTLYDGSSAAPPYGNQVWQKNYVSGVQLTGEVLAPSLALVTDQPILASLVRTAAEIAAAVTPTNYTYPECDVRRYGATTTDLTGAINTPAIQAAINVAQQLAPAAVYIPAQYVINATLRVTASFIKIKGAGRGVSGLDCNTSGIGDVLLVGTTGVTLFGVQIEDIAIQCQAGLGSPPNGITLFNCSECYIDRCFSSNHLNGIKMRGVDIVRVKDFESGGNSSTGIYLTIQGSVFSANETVWLENLNLFNNSVAAVLIGGSSNNVQIRSSWFESQPYGVLAKNDAGTNLYIDQLILDGVESWNSAGDLFTGTVLLGTLPPAGSANFLGLANTVINDCRSFQNRTSSYHITLAQNGNTNASTAYLNTQIRDGVFYSASTAVVFSDATNCTGDIRGNIIALNGFQTGATIALRAGSGTSSSTGLNIWGTEESGTWTPVDASGAGLTFSGVLARYKRKGVLVTITFQLTFPSTASGSQATIGGLPFKSISTAANMFGGNANFCSAALNVGCLLAQNDSKFFLYTANGGANVTNTQMSTNSITMTLTYESQ